MKNFLAFLAALLLAILAFTAVRNGTLALPWQDSGAGSGSVDGRGGSGGGSGSASGSGTTGSGNASSGNSGNSGSGKGGYAGGGITPKPGKSSSSPKPPVGPARLVPDGLPCSNGASCGVYGSGFEPGELVDLYYTWPDSRGEAKQGPRRADDGGRIDWSVLHAIKNGGTVHVRAVGRTSGLTASTSYHDSGPY
ncbi:hypothetical protein [Streptomyces xantholiticus]|uniref:hypothetical protein n=1 Tax=Streptomyces xantholiticus TaxID=68285 RepID=UPI00167287DE|nr:hypothetical protein [Streptomyces xantholiticus]GGW70096.1 hypothetical protein GCM10010381_63650 [Streptomyces xantholiticus]